MQIRKRFFFFKYIFSFAWAAYKVNTCKLIVILNLKWLPYQVHFASKSQLFKTHFYLKCYKIVLILTLIDMLYRCWQYLTWKYSIKNVVHRFKKCEMIVWRGAVSLVWRLKYSGFIIFSVLLCWKHLYIWYIIVHVLMLYYFMFAIEKINKKSI